MSYIPGEAPEAWERHRVSRGETVWGDGEVLTSREDLIEATGMAYDNDRAEWAFPVIGMCGFPRTRLGVFIIRLTDDGELMTSLD